MKTPLPITASFLALVACSHHITVYSDVEPAIDFSLYHSFTWGKRSHLAHDDNPIYYTDLTDCWVKAVVNTILAQRNMNVSEDNPDLIIHYHIIVEDRSIIVTESFAYAYSPYWIRSTADLCSYREGTLILDVMDARTRQLVWRGWATSVINDKYEPGEIEQLLKKAIVKMFTEFPVPAKIVFQTNLN